MIFPNSVFRFCPLLFGSPDEPLSPNVMYSMLSGPMVTWPPL